ncbi:lysosome-associated membrane glycoprotein 2 [Polymixia lowei]
MGIEYIVIVKKKPWYFNLDPTRVITSGYCVNDTAFLSLNLPFNAASLQFIFKKEANASYVSKVTALIFPLPVCNGCTSKMYPGVLANDKLFRAPYGRSFKCDSQSVFVMAEDLRIKLVPLQIQAFTVPEGQYGPEVECWADFERRVIPIIMGATAVGLILITVLSYLIHRDRHRPGYERI